MHNSFKLLTAAIILIVASLTWAWPYITMEFAGSAHYTEEDRREYEFYTPDILKKIPRISSQYDFDFANITGPATHVYAIKFYGTEDTGKINAYLISLGYQHQGLCNIDNICWRGKDDSETIMVRPLKSEKGVAVQIIYDFTGE
jgi:hypothetical protein